MTIPNITTNSLVDQTQLNQIIDTVNGISSKFANAISPIYNTTTKQIVNSYMGTFAIATNRYADTLPTKSKKGDVYTKTFSIAFGKTFLAPPLVFASVDLATSNLSEYIPGIIVSNVSQSSCTITLNVFKNIDGTGELGFSLNIMAVGLSQL